MVDSNDLIYPHLHPSLPSSHAITCHQRRSAHEEQDVRRFRGPLVTSKQQQTRWWPVPTGLNIRVDTPLLGENADHQSLCKSCASYRREWPGWCPSTSLGLPKALRHCSGSLDDSSNFHRRPSDRSPFRSLRSSMFIDLALEVIGGSIFTSLQVGKVSPGCDPYRPTAAVTLLRDSHQLCFRLPFVRISRSAGALISLQVRVSQMRIFRETFHKF